MKQFEVFTAEDFSDLSYWSHGAVQKSACYDAARIANAILNEKGKRVWGRIGKSSSWSSYPPGTFIQERYTHEALLIGERPLVEAAQSAREIER